MNGVWKLRLLQLQLTLLDELEQLVVPEDGELWRGSGPLQKKSALQLHIAVWNQLAHDRLTLDLRKEEENLSREEDACCERLCLHRSTLKSVTSFRMAFRRLATESES